MATAEHRAQSANTRAKHVPDGTADEQAGPDGATGTASTSARRVDARATADRRGHGRAKAGPFADAPLRMDAMARAAVRRATSRRKSIVSGCENLAAKFSVIAGYD